MDQSFGVRVNGALVDPYKFPDVMVTTFDTDGFIANNALEIMPPFRGALTPSLPPYNAPISFRVDLATDKHGRCTLAMGGSRHINVPNRDNTACHRLIEFYLQTEQGPLDFSFNRMYRQAVMGIHNDQNITSYIWQLGRGLNLEAQICNALSMSTGKLFGAIQAIDQAVLPGTFRFPVEMPLYHAWRYYVRIWRRPHFELASRRLGEAEDHVDHLVVRVIAQGADLNNVCEALKNLRDRIFLLRFLTLAYLDGTWE